MCFRGEMSLGGLSAAHRAAVDDLHSHRIAMIHLP